jgi:hypothetical protein
MLKLSKHPLAPSASHSGKRKSNKKGKTTTPPTKENKNSHKKNKKT